MRDPYLCEMCRRAYKPKAVRGPVPGVWELKAFQGYTVDLSLEEFRKISAGRGLEQVPFGSIKGQKLLQQMHEQVMK